MKKITETTIGIFVFTLLPFTITVLTFLFVDARDIYTNIKIIMNPNNAGYLIALCLSVITFIVLYSRKSYLDKINELQNKIKALDLKIAESSENSKTLMKYYYAKNMDWIESLHQMVHDVSSNKNRTKKLRVHNNNAEKILFNRLGTYEAQFGEHTEKLFNGLDKELNATE